MDHASEKQAGQTADTALCVGCGKAAAEGRTLVSLGNGVAPWICPMCVCTANLLLEEAHENQARVLGVPNPSMAAMDLSGEGHVLPLDRAYANAVALGDYARGQLAEGADRKTWADVDNMSRAVLDAMAAAGVHP